MLSVFKPIHIAHSPHSDSIHGKRLPSLCQGNTGANEPFLAAVQCGESLSPPWTSNSREAMRASEAENHFVLCRPLTNSIRYPASFNNRRGNGLCKRSGPFRSTGQ